MTSQVTIPFDDPTQHLFDPTKNRVSHGVGGLANQYPSSELLYANFDKDGAFLSKRGQVEITLFGSDNTSEISEGQLQIGKNQDRSSAKFVSINLPLENQISGKLKTVSTVDGYSGSQYLGEIKNRADSSAIRFLTTHIGGGKHRIICNIFDAAGDPVPGTIMATVPYFIGAVNHITWSFKKGGSLNLFNNGVRVANLDLSSYDINFSQIDFFMGFYGGTVATKFNVEYVQLINADYYTGNSETETGEIYSRPNDAYYPIITATPYLLSKLKTLAAFYRNVEDVSEVKHTIMIGAVYYWIDQNDMAWKPVSNTQTDLNSIEEIQAGLDAFNEMIGGGDGVFIQLVWWVKSSTGWSNPEITEYYLEYDYALSLGADLPKCGIVVNIRDLGDNAVSEAEVIFEPKKPFFHSGSWVTKRTRLVTSTNGKLVIPVIETESVGALVTCYINYTDVDKDGNVVTTQDVFKNLTIENTTSKSLEDTVKDSAA